MELVLLKSKYSIRTYKCSTSDASDERVDSNGAIGVESVAIYHVTISISTLDLILLSCRHTNYIIQTLPESNHCTTAQSSR